MSIFLNPILANRDGWKDSEVDGHIKEPGVYLVAFYDGHDWRLAGLCQLNCRMGIHGRMLPGLTGRWIDPDKQAKMKIQRSYYGVGPLACAPHPAGRFDMDTIDVRKRFAEDTKDHRLEIVHDDGVHRCLYVSKASTSSYSFWITTWPGRLCFSGDMGCYVFSRLHDMFQFHRRGAKGESGKISFSYWAEKVEAEDRHCKVEKFEAAAFAAAARAQLAEYIAEHEGINADDQERLTEEVDQAVGYAEDGDVLSAYRAMDDAEHGRRRPFQDFSETNCDELTWSFVWCCYAIEWAIDLYDAAKAAKTDGGAT